MNRTCNIYNAQFYKTQADEILFWVFIIVKKSIKIHGPHHMVITNK